MEAQPISISVTHDPKGHKLSPQQVPMAFLRAFARDVEELLRGDTSEVDTSIINVALFKGSLGIRTEPLAHPKLLADLRLLSDSQLMEGIDARRREVVERWQKAARLDSGQIYKISSPFLPSDIVISRSSDFHADDADQWVRVERYLQGEVVEIGGQKKVNAHIRLPDGQVLIVESERRIFRDDKINRLYKPAMARIVAEYNVITRDYRNAHLVSFEEHRTDFDDAQFLKLTERGRKAWADVQSATQWVDDLRGGER